MSPIVAQHLGWLKVAITGMDESNWRDMRGQAERQIEAIAAALAVAEARPAADAAEKP